MSEQSHTVGDYLVDRLAELGLDCVFGVPGDYSLGLLDHVVRHPRVRWIGCANELNAGYAADGYARLRRIGTVWTTFGVGELSAINALAGSYAEHVPVLEVVGAPRLAAQAAGRALHHSLGDGVFHHFMDMHESVTCARAALTPDNATVEIDRVLATIRNRCLPGYLLVPADVAEAPVSPPAAPLPPRTDDTDPEVRQAFVDAVGRLVDSAGGDVAVLAGLLVHRLGASQELNRMLSAGPLVHATTLWAKSLVDESAPTFAGTYAGAASPEPTRRAIEDAAVLIMAGVQFTDLNSGMFTQNIVRSRTIDLAARSATVGAATYAPLELPTALAALADLFAARAPSGRRPSGSIALPAQQPTSDADAPLDQATMWNEVAGFLQAGDLVLADQGTAFYGMAPHRLPSGVTFVGQPLWASIGYTLPALLGAGSARPGRRGVLLIGDGAAQLTVQELSTVLRERIPSVMIVVDNDGYTVERAIHGPNEPYNDIVGWDWTVAPRLFGAQVTTHRASTVGEFRRALSQAQERPDGFALIQAVVGRDDVPDLLARLTAILGGNVGRA